MLLSFELFILYPIMSVLNQCEKFLSFLNLTVKEPDYTVRGIGLN